MVQDALHALDFSPNYAALLASLQERIRSAQARAAQAVNCELMLLHQQIGREILLRRRREAGAPRRSTVCRKTCVGCFPI